jgi:uncharacterized protein YbjT (DUF2867 family)
MAPKSREFEVVVLGASGFTGRKVVAELLEAAPQQIIK